VLVERSTRGVTLTDAGRVLLATADAIHAELRIAAQQLGALNSGGPQALTVVTFASAGEPLLAPALTAMTTAGGHPVGVTVIEAEPDEALDSVRDGGPILHSCTTSTPPRRRAPGRPPPVLAPTPRSSPSHPPNPLATSAATSLNGISQTQPPNDCSQHSTPARSRNRRQEGQPQTADSTGPASRWASSLPASARWTKRQPFSGCQPDPVARRRRR
jgi:DNA-binding transcriptional LysR family regulator